LRPAPFAMNLRQKTLLLTALPLLGLVVLLYVSLSAILQRSYARLEAQAAQRNLQRVDEVLAGDLAQLHTLTEDWAAWDDAYAFIDDRNPAFITSNLRANAFASLELNYIVFVDMAGEMIYGAGYDRATEQPIPVPASLQQHLAADSPLLRFPHLAQHYVGLVPVGDRVLLVAIEPILRSDETGPAKGALLMGRYFDEAELAELADRTRLTLVSYGLPAPVQQSIVDTLISPRTDGTTLIQPTDTDTMAGYLLLRDLYGSPRLLIEATLPRDIYRQGQLSLRYMGYALGIACLLFTLSLGYLLERVILRRLVGLGQQVQAIGRSSDLHQRVQVAGHDELNHLGQHINAMLGELETSAEKLAEEQQRAEDLLLNILPAPIADELMTANTAVPQHFDEVTILFADIVGFTPLSKRLSPIELVDLLNRVFSAFDGLAERLGLEKIKTIGDAYMVAAGLPLPRPDHAEAIAEMALAMQGVMAHIGQECGEALELRIGINTGVVVAGVIGTKKFIYDLWGDAVNVASRMESSGEPGLIQVTAATHAHLKTRYRLASRGVVTVKGRGEMQTYWLQGRLGEALFCPWPAPPQMGARLNEGDSLRGDP